MLSSVLTLNEHSAVESLSLERLIAIFEIVWHPPSVIAIKRKGDMYSLTLSLVLIVDKYLRIIYWHKRRVMIDMNLSDAALLVTDIHCQSYQRGSPQEIWTYNWRSRIQNVEKAQNLIKRHVFICEGLSILLDKCTWMYELLGWMNRRKRCGIWMRRDDS